MPDRKPLYTPETTPSIKSANSRRLTGTRTKQLIRAAGRDITDPPPKPGLGECCGSSCDPCVNDLWREELGVWRERWGFTFNAEEKGEEGEGGEDRGKKGDGKGKGKSNGVKSMQRKMPGAFEW